MRRAGVGLTRHSRSGRLPPGRGVPRSSPAHLARGTRTTRGSACGRTSTRNRRCPTRRSACHGCRENISRHPRASSHTGRGWSGPSRESATMYSCFSAVGS
ncbi:hypothetical protein T484DRAFT_1980392 [Baffinella frigidus]|nr:hypothetical protein T484DRAFT_1980392 [Cryptophyta sp. CCMP2293]